MHKMIEKLVKAGKLRFLYETSKVKKIHKTSETLYRVTIALMGLLTVTLVWTLSPESLTAVLIGCFSLIIIAKGFKMLTVRWEQRLKQNSFSSLNALLERCNHFLEVSNHPNFKEDQENILTRRNLQSLSFEMASRTLKHHHQVESKLIKLESSFTKRVSYAVFAELKETDTLFLKEMNERKQQLTLMVKELEVEVN